MDDTLRGAMPASLYAALHPNHHEKKEEGSFTGV
jgi:hypothetical protein